SAGADFVAANGAAAVAAMATAGEELVALVKNRIVANGANFVTVNNLPDIASTPSGLSKGPAIQSLILAMTEAFNTKLASGLAGEPKVLVVDVYWVSHDETVNPGPYGLTNVTDTACDLSPAKNPLGSALVCNAGNLKPGDVSHYAYADDVHPTPFNNLLLARYVSEKMVVRGWL
ncbi:MAG: esterase, partial [Burkholderiaceae bacterium]|nr:esterase [Burkholderiaceae bacterium]